MNHRVDMKMTCINEIFTCITSLFSISQWRICSSFSTDTAFLKVLYVKSLLYKFWKFAFLQKSHILRFKMWASTSDAFPQFWSWGCEISCIWMVLGRIGHLWSYFVKRNSKFRGLFSYQCTMETRVDFHILLYSMFIKKIKIKEIQTI